MTDQPPVTPQSGEMRIPLVLNIGAIVAIVALIAAGASWKTSVNMNFERVFERLDQIQDTQEGYRIALELAAEDRWKRRDMSLWQQTYLREFVRWVSDVETEIEKAAQIEDLELPVFDLLAIPSAN